MNGRSLILLFLFLPTASPILQCQEDWVNVSAPYGDIGAVVATDMGSVLMGTSTGLWKSTDRGTSWQSADIGLPASGIFGLAVAGHTIISGTPCGVFRSRDDGTSWTKTDLPDSTFRFVVGSPDGRLYVKIGGGDVYRSDDSGETWEPLGLADKFGGERQLWRLYHWGTNSQGQIYTDIDTCTLLTSTDYGNSWLEIPGPVPQCKFYSRLAVYEDAIYVVIYPEGVFRSSNDGASWEHIPVPVGSPYEVSVGPGGGMMIATNRPHRVYSSTDSGRTFISDNQAYVRRIIVPLTRDTLLAGVHIGLHEGALLRSVNGGRDWETLVPSFRQLECLESGPGKLIFAGTKDEGFWRSTDGGLRWDPVLTAGMVSGISISQSGLVLAATLFEGAYLSTDGGSTWTPTFAHGLNDSMITSVACSESGTFFVGTRSDKRETDGKDRYLTKPIYSGGGLWKSRDGGNSWNWIDLVGGIVNQEQSRSDPTARQSIAIRPDSSYVDWTVEAVGTDPDGGIMVARRGNNFEPRRYRTTDLGDTWNWVDTLKPMSYDDIHLRTHIYKTTRGDYFFGYHRSTDRGNTYDDIVNGSTPTDGEVTRPGPDGSMILGTHIGGFLLPAGGNTWFPIGFDTCDWTAVGSSDGSILASVQFDYYDNRNGVYRKRESAVYDGLPVPTIPPDRWAKIHSPFDTLAGFLTSPESGTLWAWGPERRLAHSTDFGSSWIVDTIPFKKIDHLAIDPAGGALIAGGEPGWWRSVDDAKSWERYSIDQDVTPGVIQLSGVKFVYSVPNGTLLAPASSHGSYPLYRRQPGSALWEVGPTSLPGEVRWFYASPTGTLFASISGLGLWRSSDHGDTWVRSDAGMITPRARTGNRRMVVWDSTVHSMVWDGKGSLYASVGFRTVCISSDDGASWMVSPSLSGRGDDIIFGTPDRLCLRMGSRLWISGDHGQPWQPYGAGLTSDKVFNVILHPDGHLYAATRDGKLFRTNDE